MTPPTTANVPRGPHQGQPVLHSGEPLETARAATLLIHGRGASAADILTLADALDVPGVTYLAPQAAGHTWYPNSFLAPIASNEPGLSSGLQVIADLFAHLSAAGMPPIRTLLLGFSQGACLSLEYVARNARRYGGVAGLSGALIGPDGTPRDYPSTFDGTPVFLGCSDVDFHIPAARVRESAEVFRRLGADVTMRLYPKMDHTVNDDELAFVRAMLTRLTE
jgi:predicted esterase